MIIVVSRYVTVAPRYEYGAGFARRMKARITLFGDPVREEMGAAR